MIMRQKAGVLVLGVVLSACAAQTIPEGCIEDAKPLVACANIWVPVCGCDHVTYMNECMAWANGLTSWRRGGC